MFDAPPIVGSFPGINSVKKYAKEGWRAAAFSKSSLRADKNILSVYHASALSYSESPVLNGPPREESLAGYCWWIVLYVPFSTVVGSMSRFRM